MSNVIDFLERVGGDSDLRYAPRAELDRAMQQAQMSAELRAALLEEDPALLKSLVCAPVEVCCGIFAPLREDEDDQKTKPKESVKAA